MKILLLSPCFAPDTAVGALRMSSLARYLLAHGDQVTVLREIKSGKVENGHRCFGAEYIEVDVTNHSYEQNIAAFSAAAEQLCQREIFDCCIASFGPYYTIQAAERIAREYCIPLIVDYRDLWLYNPRPALSLKAFIAKHVFRVTRRGLERELLKSCSAFVSVTPKSIELMTSHYSFLKGKSVCIYNGHELSAERISGPSEHDDIVICFLGKFSYYSAEYAEEILSGISKLSHSGVPVRIIHVGEPENVGEMLKKYELDNKYTECGYKPYDEAIQIASQADIFAEVNCSKYELGTKVFDYIAMNRPLIVAAPPDSELEYLLKDAENAYVCQQREQIYSALKTIVNSHAKKMTVQPGFSEKFSRERSNAEFRCLIKNVVSGHSLLI